MKFIGMDVHKKSITMAAFSQDGKKIMGKKNPRYPRSPDWFLRPPRP